MLFFRSRPLLAVASTIGLLTWASFDDPKYHRILQRQWEPSHQAMLRILEVAEPGDLVTSFPDQFHHFFKMNLGSSAVLLPNLVDDRAKTQPGRLLILTRVESEARPWLEHYFELEEFGDSRFTRKLHLLISKQVPAGPDALRVPLEQFYYSLLGSVMDGGQLHAHNIRAHFGLLRRVHARLEHLSRQAGKGREWREHRRLYRNPQHWGGDMQNFPIVKAWIEYFRPPELTPPKS